MRRSEFAVSLRRALLQDNFRRCVRVEAARVRNLLPRASSRQPGLDAFCWRPTVCARPGMMPIVWFPRGFGILIEEEIETRYIKLNK